jgi:hypothetical protein
MPPTQGSFYEDLYPRGLRKLFAIGLICATTLLPAITAWKAGPQPVPQPGPAFGPRFGTARRGSDDRKNAAAATLPIGRTMLAMLGGMLGLAIYFPRRGFKRCALLAGPVLGLGSMFVAGWYLSGRSTVYRFEAVFSALIGALPGVALYIALVRRKWHKRHSADTMWIE